MVAAVCACNGVQASDPPSATAPRAGEFRSSTLDTVLESASDTIRTRGFAVDGDVGRGFLVDRSSASSAASLQSGHCYIWVAVTSSQLDALQLALYDSAGGEVQRAAPTATPALRYCPTESGDHYIAWRASGTGLYAMQRFSGPRGLDIRLDDLVPTENTEPAGP